jgi:arabinose-5-phosphate isomerase
MKPEPATIDVEPALPGTAATESAQALAMLARGRRVLRLEAEGIAALVPRLGNDFARACKTLLQCRGRVIVSGIGKSGHVARKIAATFASTGTPAFFVHPAEASHGDLGMVTRDDVFLALSNSGNTEELMAIVPLIKRMGAALILMTGNAESALARLADIHLDARVEQEACPLNLAPTTSTTAALALGDALAVALLEARGFSESDFARSHPGGMLGRRLLTRVSDVMRGGPAIPRVAEDASLTEALLEITRKRMGMTLVVTAGDHDQLLGIFTDGDLRRLLERSTDLGSIRIDSVMTRAPRTLSSDALAVEALRCMDEQQITQLAVVDDHRVVGALHLHDLLAAKIA